jgi:hypothetical protein
VHGPNGLLLETEEAPELGFDRQLGLAGTIISKRFYDRNKHVYPLKNWKQ